MGPNVDGSIRGLLESTFTPTAHGSSQVFMPLPMNALSETLRERRSNQNAGGGHYNISGRNPFSAAMPSHFRGGGGKHSRGVSTSAVDVRAGGGGKLAQTLGSSDVARRRLKSDSMEIDKIEAFSELNERTLGGGGGEGGGRRGWADTAAAIGDSDDDEWDPFASGATKTTATATTCTRGRSNPNDDDSISTGHNNACRNSTALHRAKSRKLLQVGELAGRDPREAAKLMQNKVPVFVEVDENGAPAPRGSHYHHNIHILPRLHLHQLGRRKSHQGITTVPTPSPTTVIRRFSRAGIQTDKVDSGSTAARESTAHATGRRQEQRRHSSGSETTMGTDTVKAAGFATQPTSGGGFAFSCDAKAQRAEIAMILGTRASPMPRTASFLARQNSPAQVRATTIALEGVSEDGGVEIDAGDDGGSGGEDAGGGGKELPPLQRRSSGVCAAATTDSGPTRDLSSQQVPSAPSNVVVEEEKKGAGVEEEGNAEEEY